MTSHSSATVRETPHVRLSRTNTIMNALRRRAEAVLNDKTIDQQTRTILRRAMEIHDPWLARLVRRADAGERIDDTIEQEPETRDPDATEKIEALVEIICGADEQAAAALLVLMGTLQNSAHPKVLANTAKHFAFTRCGELNLYGMVDAQIAVVESELLVGNSFGS